MTILLALLVAVFVASCVAAMAVAVLFAREDFELRRNIPRIARKGEPR